MNESQDRISSLSSALKTGGIKSLFDGDNDRADRFAFQAADLDFDLSKTHLTPELVSAYIEFAQAQRFDDLRHAMFAGEKINESEGRAVLHTLLRRSDGNDDLPAVSEELAQQKDSSAQSYLELLRRLEYSEDEFDFEIKDIIHIGIGGSVLGPQLLSEAFDKADRKFNVHFVSNIDAHEIVHVINRCNPATTLLVGVSKTFTTLETITNINSLMDWLRNNGVEQPLDRVLAITASPDNALEFGIKEHNIATFPNWVGGRYSLWSSVSLSPFANLSLEELNAFLKGAEDMDTYFYATELESNVCFLSAVLDHFYGNFFGAQTRATFAYDFRLRSLVSYLQQLETESNGKDRLRNGEAVGHQTSPVVWGGVGTDVQHSVFQLLHQGTVFIPSEFILVAQPDHQLIDNHRQLLANAIAQTAALLKGQTLQDLSELEPDGTSAEVLNAKLFSGDRPSSNIIMPKLNAYSLGALIAFYEHRTFSAGILYGINSFDQMGVELGKRLARQVGPHLRNSEGKNAKGELSDGSTFDPSTLRAINKLRSDLN